VRTDPKPAEEIIDIRERPILFSGPMVRAILEGRKTQMRRIVKHPEYYGCPTGDCPHSLQIHCNAAMNEPDILSECPYGKPGDLLWVRETWFIASTDTGSVSIGYKERLPAGKTLTDTDGGLDVIRCLDREIVRWAEDRISDHWRPSIFMPRWASRITLEITDVRVERLNDISEANAYEEGVSDTWPLDSLPYLSAFGGRAVINNYAHLWKSINGNGSWAKNPWVWVISYKRI
jgi:hypothetical protein